MRDYITKITRFFFLKARRDSCINKENPPRWEEKKFQLHKISSSFSSSSSSFAGLIIGEATDPLLPDHPFAGSRCNTPKLYPDSFITCSGYNIS